MGPTEKIVFFFVVAGMSFGLLRLAVSPREKWFWPFEALHLAALGILAWAVMR